MYSGIAMATSTAAPITCNQPCGRRRVASKASASTSTPSRPAMMRWNCSRQALLGSIGRIAVAAWSAALAWSGVDGQVAMP